MVKRKALAILLTFAMVFGSFCLPAGAETGEPQTDAVAFSDVSGHWAEAAIYKWSGNGIINGYQGLFRPDDSITRGEMAVILDNMMDYQVAVKNTFVDLAAGQFYTDPLLKAYAAGIIKGDAGKLRPTDKITREEAAVMLGRAFAVKESTAGTASFNDAAEVSSWAKGYVKAMEAKGYIKGSNNSFRPKANITRAEIVTIIDNAVKAYYKDAGTYTENVNGTAIIKVTGVKLKGVTVSGNLIIAEGVGQGDVTLDSVTVKGETVVRGGGENSVNITGDSDITNVRIEKIGGKIRITVSDGNTVQQIEVAEGEEIIITGTVGTIDIAAPNTTIVASNANIGSINVESNASNTTIETRSGAVIGTVNASAQTTVSGQGTVSNVNLNEGADNSKVTTPNTKTKVAQGVTGVTGGGGTAIPGGSTATNNSSGNGVTGGSAGGGGGGGGGVDLPPFITVRNPSVINATTITFASVAVDNISFGGTPVVINGTEAPKATYAEGVYTVILAVDNPLQVGSNTLTLKKSGYRDTSVSINYAGRAVSSVAELEAAIDEAAEGDTIVLSAGEYQLNNTLVITKNGITILGPQANVDPRPSKNSIRTDDTNEAVLTGDKGDVSDPISKADAQSKGWLDSLFEIRAHHVTINGLTLERTHNHIIYSQTAQPVGEAEDRTKDLIGLKIINNIVREGRGNEGIKIGRSINALVQYNYIYDIRYDGDAIEAYDVKGFRILDNEIDGCDSINGTIRVCNNVGGEDGIVRGNLIMNTSYHFAINAEDCTGDVIIDNNEIRNAAAGGIFVYKNTGDISVTNNRIDTYATSPVSGTDYRQTYLRNGASAIFISYNLRDNITQPVITVTGNTTNGGAAGVPVLCFGGGTTDSAAIPTDLSNITVTGNTFDRAYIKYIKAAGNLTGIADNIWLGVPDNTVINLLSGQSFGNIPDAVAQAAEGELMLLAPGTYELTATVALTDKKINLIGAGRESTVINYNGTVQNAGLFATPDNSALNGRISFYGIGFNNISDGVSKGNYVFLSIPGTNANEAYFDKCSFNNFYTIAYFNNTHSGQENNNKISITNCEINNVEWVYSQDDITVGSRPIQEDNVTIRNNTGDSANKGREVFGGITVRDRDTDESKARPATIQAAVSAASSGDTILVGDGTYQGNIVIDKKLKLLSLSGAASTIIEGNQSGAELGTIVIKSGIDEVQIGDIGKGFTILGIDGPPGIEKAAVYFQGANSGSKVIGNNIVANGDEGLLTEYNAAVVDLLVDSNTFSGKTFIGDAPGGDGFSGQFTEPNVPRQLVVISGGAGVTNTQNITFTNNIITGIAGGINAEGNEQGNSLVTIDTVGAVITGNTFGGYTNRNGASLRVRGTDAIISGNSFSDRNPVHMYVRNTAVEDLNTLIQNNSFITAPSLQPAGDDYSGVL